MACTPPPFRFLPADGPAKPLSPGVRSAPAQKALPAGCHVKAVRIDAAGYQQSIIEYCDAHGIAYAIRATMIKSIRRWASQRDDDEWEVMYDKHGQPTGQSVICTTHCIGDYDIAK